MQDIPFETSGRGLLSNKFYLLKGSNWNNSIGVNVGMTGIIMVFDMIVEGRIFKCGDFVEIF